jgi:hypothetical protein
MKHLLLAPFLLGFISPISAESVWLIIHTGNSGVEKIEMKDLDQCIEESGEAFKKNLKTAFQRKYVCIKGK